LPDAQRLSEGTGNGWHYDLETSFSCVFEPCVEWTFPQVRSPEDPAVMDLEFQRHTYPAFSVGATQDMQESDTGPDFELSAHIDQIDEETLPEEISEKLLLPNSCATSAETGFNVPPLPREMSAYWFSLTVHLIMFGLLMTGAASTIEGLGNNVGGAALTATLLDHIDSTPREECPASVDSPASSPAIADSARAQDPLHTKEPVHESKNILETHDQAAKHHSAHMEAPKDNPKTTEDDAKKTTKRTDSDGKGPDEADSAPSTPSTASPERRMARAETRDGDRFKGQVLSAVHEAAFFPAKAAGIARLGEVIVAVTIHRDGSVSDPALVKRSGSEILDDAAIRIVRKAAKRFPPIPEGMSAQSVSYEIPIIFRKKGS
jgi:TonB family protein